MRIMKEATEKEEKAERKNPHTQRRGRITAGDGHPKWQRKLKPNSESGSKEESWPIGEKTEAISP